MDVSKLSRGQMILAAGGILLIISLFLSWAEGDFGGSASAFDAFSGMDIILLLIGIAAVAVAAMVMAEAASRLPAAADLILLALGLIALGWAFGWDLENDSAGIGAWLALIASGAIVYGAMEGAQGQLGVRLPSSAGRGRPGGAEGSPGTVAGAPAPTPPPAAAPPAAPVPPPPADPGFGSTPPTDPGRGSTPPPGL